MTPRPVRGQQNNGDLPPLRRIDFHEVDSEPNTIMFRGTLEYRDQILWPTLELDVTARFTELDDEPRLRDVIAEFTAELRAAFIITATEPDPFVVHRPDDLDCDPTADEAEAVDAELMCAVSLRNWESADQFSVVVIDPPLRRVGHHHWVIDQWLNADQFRVTVTDGPVGDQARVRISGGWSGTIGIGQATSLGDRKRDELWVSRPELGQVGSINYVVDWNFHKA